jgi:hypothetical protein
MKNERERNCVSLSLFKLFFFMPKIKLVINDTIFIKKKQQQWSSRRFSKPI